MRKASKKKQLDPLQVKINQMQEALLTIKRLMPEVEADLHLMGGVGAALEKTKDEFKSEVVRKFFKRTKQFSKP